MSRLKFDNITYNKIYHVLPKIGQDKVVEVHNVNIGYITYVEMQTLMSCHVDFKLTGGIIPPKLHMEGHNRGLRIHLVYESCQIYRASLHKLKSVDP